tara:strand:- start:8282 stop:9463 length:1182 start_codon:yes stop_codon:yes gene_type:complete
LSHLLWRYRRPIFFAFLLTFLSGFGQSYFISLFIPSFLERADVSNTTFGTIYALATLASGFALPWAGRQLDHIDVALYAKIVFLGLIVAAITTAFAANIYLLIVAIFLLRFFGQGLFGHTSDTITARKFAANRGKALSLAGLGYPVSEATLPLLAVFCLKAYGVQTTWLTIAAIIACVLPFINYFANARGEVEFEHEGTSHSGVREFTGLKSLTFWVWASAGLMPPFLLTALFLYNAVIAELRGWTLEWMATSFVAFAVFRFSFSLIGGTLVDRFGAKNLYPWHLIPLSIGIATLALVEQSYAAPVYLGLAGISIGLGAPIKTALWAELYGVRHLARIRSWLSSLGVIGTAAGPPTLALLIDSKVSLTNSLLILSISLSLVILACGILKRDRR